MPRAIEDMIVVITGASAGIGEALARALAARGARLVLSARRTDRLEALNASLGGHHLIVTADVSKRDDCEQLIERTIGHFGRIDTLVCNAGYGSYKMVSEMPPEKVREMFATNVFGTTDCIHSAIPQLLKQELRDGWRGQTMIVSSAAARRSPPFMGVYSATKAAQLSVAEAMRVELASSNIAVTSVHPIMTRTEFGQVAEATGDVKFPRSRASQSVEHVADCMVRAILRPKPEVWPHRMSRWALSLAAFTPRFTDRLMKKYRDQITR